MHGSRKQERDLPVSSNDIATRVTNPGKGHAIYDNPRDRLKQFLTRRLQLMLGRTPKQRYCEFWDLKEISFEIKIG
jgi:lipopolysaccharide transport system ATP-binding protein